MPKRCGVAFVARSKQEWVEGVTVGGTGGRGGEGEGGRVSVCGGGGRCRAHGTRFG